MITGEPRSPVILGWRRSSSASCATRLLQTVSSLALAGVGACGSGSIGHRTSPFALYGRDDMRAGLAFHVLDDAAHKESIRPYQCVPLWAKARRCALPIETGFLVAILDSTDRVIRLLSASDSLSRSRNDVHGLLIFRDVVRETRASWDSAGTLHRDGMDAESPQLHWVDESGRWGASLWYSRSHRADVRTSPAVMDTELAMSLPESLGVTDLPAYQLFMERRPTPPAPPTPAPRAVPVATVPPTPRELLRMLQSDLRALTIAEEGVVHRDGRYETVLEKLSITPSAGGKLELIQPTPDGWSAVATHPSLPGVSCVVFAGNVSASPATQKEGRRGGPGDVVCDNP
jgi:hypothetical protein